jgi:serine/threonine-protein kinase
MTGNVLALSADSRNLVYVANDRLYLRPLSDFQARPIIGTEAYQSVTDPVFSPDGKWIAFYARGEQAIKRISIAGGAAVTICKAGLLFGMEWAADAIYFGQSQRGVMRVSPEGGAPEEVVHANPGEQIHGPHLLPGGRHMLLTIAHGNDFNRWNNAKIVVVSLSTKERGDLVQGGSDGRYVPTGHLIYTHRERLLAIPFDLSRMATRGSPSPVVEGMSMSGGQSTGAVQLSVAENGSIAYLPGMGLSNLPFSLGFADRSGKIERLNVLQGSLQSPRISPDGKHIAFAPDYDDKADEPAVVWIYDLAGNKALRRLTYAGNSHFPIWTADSSRVVFQSDREGDLALFSQRADGSGTAERLTRPEKGAAHIPESWSRTENVLLYSIYDGRDYTLWTLSARTGKSTPFGGVRSIYPTDARFSPNGKWVAYASAETLGPTTIYVQPFPSTGAKYQLYVKGVNDTPQKPAWSPDGRELFYVPRFGGFESVKVTTRPEFAFGTASPIPRSFITGSPSARNAFDVTPDGRFLGMFASSVPSQFRPPDKIAVVLGWFDEIRAKTP